MVAETAVAQFPRTIPRRRQPSVTYLPRIAPPVPAYSLIGDLRATAKVARLKLYAWQELAGRYMTATRGKRWRYRELCIVVARQNGKTGLLVPRIVMGLQRGERIMMTAQDRQLVVRDVFNAVADIMERTYSFDMAGNPRRANGQEQISMVNGGRFRIVAPNRSGARGPANDLVIVDEVREMQDFDFIAAAKPTLTVSRRPQMIYLSNAGDGNSVVLEALALRAATDPSLGYLEWSADPDRLPSDQVGWRQANPRLYDGDKSGDHWRTLEDEYRTNLTQGTMPIFETEHLCRSVPTLQPRVVSDAEWQHARGMVTEPAAPVMAVKVDPEGRRASAAIAWMSGGNVYVRSFAEDNLSPIDLDAFAAELKPLVRQFRIGLVGYDPWTDRDLARHFPGARAINGADYYAAGERFVRVVTGGQLRHDDDGTIASDLAYTVRRETANGWFATRADAERPTTAAEAAIRAVWLATEPGSSKPKVH